MNDLTAADAKYRRARLLGIVSITCAVASLAFGPLAFIGIVLATVGLRTKSQGSARTLNLVGLGLNIALLILAILVVTVISM